jgi:hypothetical protein
MKLTSLLTDSVQTKRRSRSLGELVEVPTSQCDLHFLTSCDYFETSKPTYNFHSSSSHLPKISFNDDRTLDEYSNSVFDEESTLDCEFEFLDDSVSTTCHRSKSSPVRFTPASRKTGSEVVTLNPLFKNPAVQDYLDNAKKSRYEVTTVNPLYRNLALHQFLGVAKPQPMGKAKSKRRSFFEQLPFLN